MLSIGHMQLKHIVTTDDMPRYMQLTVCLTCRLSQTSFSTVSALTFTVQINYCATVLWAALDSYAPAAWNSYSPAVVAYLTAAISSLMDSRVSLGIVKAYPVSVIGLWLVSNASALRHNCHGHVSMQFAAVCLKCLQLTADCKP